MDALKRKLSNDRPRFSFATAGLVVLADLKTVALRTALTGTSSLLDPLIICPGLQKQQDAPELSKGEYPACAAMTTGYVFRVENEATVFHLQRMGRTGHLTTVKVSHETTGTLSTWTTWVCYHCAVTSFVLATALLFFFEDWWAVFSVVLLVLVRLVNVIILRRRAVMGWKGEPEPGIQGDLLVVLSQDKWIRMQGAVDDLKPITSGQWLREPTFAESSLISTANILIYLHVALLSNARLEGHIVIFVLLICSAALLGTVNACTHSFRMYGRSICADGPPKGYKRRLDLADELIRATGRKDWAIRMGMVQADDPLSSEQGPKFM